MAPSLRITKSWYVGTEFGCLHAYKVLYFYVQHRTTKQYFNLNGQTIWQENTYWYGTQVHKTLSVKHKRYGSHPETDYVKV